MEPSLRGKSDANECNESSLSNCRVQLALSTKRDGVIFEKTAQRAVTSFSFREWFLSPTRGTEGVVKTIEERLGEKGGALLAGETER